MRIQINPENRLRLENIADKSLCLQGRVENCQAKGAFTTEDLIDMARSVDDILSNLIVLKEIERRALRS